MKGILLLTGMFFCSLCIKAQGGFDYYISNAGNDANRGNSNQVPKRTIAGVAATVANGAMPVQPLKIGFKTGDVFNETFFPGFPVFAGTYFDNSSSKNFAILNGTAVFDTGWVRTPGTSNIYEQSIPVYGFTGYGINNVGSYSIVSVFEIDRVLEQTSPFTARKVLQFFNGLQTAEAVPGSFYEPITVNINPIKVYIHTSDGSSPNNNPRYRYEVTVRDRAINSTYQENNHFERLWVRGYGAGNGMIPAGANTTFNRMILGPGAGIHHLGLRGASINNSLFLPGALNTGFYSVVFYDVEGHQRHNSIKNSIFLDITNPIYAHTSLASSFAALELDNVIGMGDTTQVQSFIEIASTDSLVVNNVYTSGYKYGYGFGYAPYVSVKNSSFIDAVAGICMGTTNLTGVINNCFVRTRGNTQKSFGVVMADSTNLILANSIIHLKNYRHSNILDYMGSFIDGAGEQNNRVQAYGNIFISDIDPSQYVLAQSCANPASSNAAASSWQNNVYILLRGNKLAWRIFRSGAPGSQDVLVNFEQWKQRTGNDANSLFFDLRNDPRGLKAIFVDPDNGDYSLANTPEGNQVRTLRAGMVSPISCFIKKPTYEEAAKIIMSDAVLSANACRQPCVQNNIRINHQFDGTLTPGNKVQLQWSIEDERGIDHYEIVRSFGNADFNSIAYVPAAGGLADYTYTDSNVLAGITYRYSLLAVTQLLEKCYSTVRSVKLEDGKPVTLFPNPSQGKVKLLLNSYTGPVKISVVNVLGVTVYSRQHNSVYGFPVEIDLSAKSKGFYWMRIQTDKASTLQSFMLQ